MECERIIFNGESLQAVNGALLEKAACYKQLGRYGEASQTLSRLRMYAFTEEERQAALYEQELCWFLEGEFSQAATLVPEVEPVSREILLLHALVLAYAGNYDESEIYAARYISWKGESPHLDELLQLYAGHPRHKKVKTASILSLVPPLGHFYNEAWGEGLLSAGLNAGALAFTVANLLGGYWVSGILGGSILLNYTFMGGQERNAALAEKHNNNSPIVFGDKVRAFLAGLE